LSGEFRDGLILVPKPSISSGKGGSRAPLDIHYRQHKSHQTKGTNNIKYHTRIMASKVMQYDYLYQQKYGEIEHKKGIGTCLDGQRRTRRQKKKPAIRNRQPSRRLCCLAPALVCICSGMVYVLIGGGHTQIQCF
jgi:hypothetical protein